MMAPGKGSGRKRVNDSFRLSAGNINRRGRAMDVPYLNKKSTDKDKPLE